MRSTLRLFKAVIVESDREAANPANINSRTVRSGFILAPSVIANHPDVERLILEVEATLGLTPEQMNASLHKSWGKVRNAPMIQLVLEQLIHYMTTYGYESWGIFSNDTVFIPYEQLNIPELKEGGIPLVVIQGISKEELRKKLLGLLGSGVALGENTIKGVLDVVSVVGISEEDLEGVRNKEVKAALYDHLNLFPKNPVEFLRYVVYRTTGQTLLIKNDELIKKIKSKNQLNELKIFQNYEEKYGFEALASIFYRFKPLFLAFRENSGIKKVINRIRRLAVDNHKPMPKDLLNDITGMICEGQRIDMVTLEKELDRVNTFRKIRLAYALHYRTKDVDSILYRVRNGKGFADSFHFDKEKRKTSQAILSVVIDSIVRDVSKNVKGKKIYIPKYMNYTLPATEKQFTGYLPSGSYVDIPSDMVFGIHWKDGSFRTDLDLSIMNPETGKIGWDAQYRTEEREILFSGDATSAGGPNGATELFYVQRQSKTAFIVFVNFYNYEKDTEIPFKIMVGTKDDKDFTANYMIDPNHVVCVAPTTIDQRQKVLGLVVGDTDRSRFYFCETYLGRSITARKNDFVEKARKYLFKFYEDTISLNDVLLQAGAILVEQKSSYEIDLSPEALKKDTILSLLV